MRMVPGDFNVPHIAHSIRFCTPKAARIFQESPAALIPEFFIDPVVRSMPLFWAEPLNGKAFIVLAPEEKRTQYGKP